MVYFEHSLREAGVTAVSSVYISGPPGVAAISHELADEIRDVFPDATIHELAPAAAPPACDLFIAIFSEPHRFPLHDVVYERLFDLDRLIVQARDARYIMLYRATWRAAEVVEGARLRRRVRQLKRERRIIQLLQRSPRLRQLLRPLYGQGN